jgi:hypothetical protein
MVALVTLTISRFRGSGGQAGTSTSSPASGVIGGLTSPSTLTKHTQKSKCGKLRFKNWMRWKETIQTNLAADLLLDLDLKRNDWSVVWSRRIGSYPGNSSAAAASSYYLHLLPHQRLALRFLWDRTLLKYFPAKLFRNPHSPARIFRNACFTFFYLFI